MPIAAVVTPGEKERQVVAALEGRPWRMFLAQVGLSGLGAGDTLAAWEAQELPLANGYAPVTGTVGAGALNVGTGAYEAAEISATFTASGLSLIFDRAILVIGDAGPVWPTYPHSVITCTDEGAENVVLAPGVPRTIKLRPGIGS